MEVTYCKSCNLVLDGLIDIHAVPRDACPNCGATSRIYDAELSESVVVHEKWKFRNKRPGVKKAVWEVTIGDDLHRDTQKWNHLEMHIDRENNAYFKKVVDPETGEVLRYCEEPLSDHQDRGSAKHKKS